MSNILENLESGKLRAVTFNKGWKVNIEVKKKILDLFKCGKLKKFEDHYIDKDFFYLRKFTTKQKVRIPPRGSAVRAGAYIAKDVIIMPPSFVNVGAYVDTGTMIDSHVLVGSLAQIGKRVHLSAGVVIGGVLEPIGELPVIIEDDAFIGAGAVIVEGVLVESRAIVAPGVVLSKSIPIYDIVNKKVLKGKIPSGAVVVNGSRPINLTWAQKEKLSANCAIIIKYRDSKTDNSLQLEKILR